MSEVIESLKMSGYPSKAIEYYVRKINVGEIGNPNVRLAYTGPCGDTMEVFLEIESNVIKDAKFRAMRYAGATGAFLSSALILILGFANLLAEGFSMAAGNYLGTKSEIEYSEKERERETWEIENILDAEREEIHQIFRRKGLASHLADKLAEIITQTRRFGLTL